ncbi:MAG: hypothetical protein K2K91_00600 [Ruminococcus sp.]|nr:hypothetical protein [Ruminococcus sp.]MDE7099493.1 hypothetical protein [Ruminococcus sp.]
MLKESLSIILALASGIIPTDKSASFSSNFSLSTPVFRQSVDGTTQQLPTISPLKEYVNIKGSSDNLPEKFDLRDMGKMSPIRNQTGYGTCWVHSAVASAETSIIDSKPDIDLSEFHTAYYVYSGDEQVTLPFDSVNSLLNHGGTNYAVTNLWSQWLGPVFEKRLRYGDEAFFEDDNNVAMMKYKSDYHLKNTYTFDYNKERTNFNEVNSLVKQFVRNGQAVDVSFYSNQEKCYSSEYKSTNSKKKAKFANHSVVIAGWDDNYSAENFIVKPEHNGAWLVKNSWGEGFGDDGYMWISYDDTSLCEFAVYELENSDKYLFNYYHDTFVALQSLSADDSDVNNGSYMANVFHNYYDETQIEAVSTYISVPDTDYEITVYTNLTDVSNPTSGTPSAVTRGHQELTGYFTLPLDNYAIVGEDEDFSVVVKLYSENSPYVIPVETSLNVTNDETGEIASLGSFTTYEGIMQYTNENESFYSADGIEWYDVYRENYVYTDEEEQLMLLELEEELFDGLEEDDTEELLNAEMAMELYKELFESGTVAITMGNISLKAIGNPVGYVDFSHDSGVVPDGTEIEISAKNGEKVYLILNNELIEYTEPIKITEYTEICASYNEKAYSIRTYIPESVFTGYGDVDGNGIVDSADASLVLEAYAYASTEGFEIFNGFIADYADFNQDNMTDANDASGILALYAENSTK